MFICGAILLFFFFQAEDGIRDLVRSRGLGDLYKRQGQSDLGEPPDLVGDIDKPLLALVQPVADLLMFHLSLIHI